MNIIVTESQILEMHNRINGNSDISEDVIIPINSGDTVLTGKFKNKKTVIKDIGKDEHGMPTINGKQAVTFRTTSKPITEVKSDEVDLSSFDPHKELNNKIWMSEYKLNNDVRLGLLKIADDFLDSLNVEQKYCKDILLLGSLANYNWSKYSDLDLHILIDFSKINKDIELVKEYFDAKRKRWNEEHDSLNIYKFPIEIYVQDINEQNSSQGIYSIEKNKWIKRPNINDEVSLDVDKIKIKSADIMTSIDDLKKRNLKTKSIPEVEKIAKKANKIFDSIKRIRKSGLESKRGEQSTGNIIFKVLRRSGYLEKLVKLKQNAYDKINTIK
jgi:hypothetical protein